MREPALFYVVVNAFALALYGVAAFLHVRSGLREDDVPAHARWFASVGVVVHGGGLVYEIAQGVLPGFAESLSAAAFGVMVATVLVSRDRLASLGMFLVPAATILLGASFFAPSTTVAALREGGGSLWLPVHLGLVFAAMAGFFLEFCVGMLQLVIRRRLKQKRLSGLGRFPALDVLERTQFRALVFGLACLGLGIVVGVVWASSVMPHQAWITDPKVWVTAVVWLWYAITLQVRVSVGWRPRWSMWLSAIGFVGLLFSFVGLEFLARGFHAYGG